MNDKKQTNTKYEDLLQTTSDGLHRLFWGLRIDQLGTWSEILKGFAQLDLHVLKLIAERPGIILKEICDELGIPNSTLTSAINRLEKRGLLKRVISQRDRRSFELEMTKKGWEIKAEHDRVDRIITTLVLDALDDDETQHFVALLAKVCQHLR